MSTLQGTSIKAIIGLGNPGKQYYKTRHNIGFLVLDVLCDRYGGTWQAQDIMDVAEIRIGSQKILLVKPQTFMNSSGRVMPLLKKQGIGAENILVVHDELEKPFGKLAIKMDGSARGHNGLRSIIEQVGSDFARLRFGIGRPADKAEVGNFVLQNFSELATDLALYIDEAATMIENLFSFAE